MARCDRAHPDARNFGLGSRDLARAGHYALREGMRSHSSTATMGDRWSQFAAWARAAGLRDLRQIAIPHLRAYATHLHTRLQQQQISPTTAQNLLSAVNRVLEIARGDRMVRLDPVRDAGLPTRSGIATTDHAVSLSQHDNAWATLPERLAAILVLQRELGLRFEEAAKLDAVRALAQAQRGTVRIEAGTKGGLARDLPITRPLVQKFALLNATMIQGEARSMIPGPQSYRAFRAEAYAALRAAGIRSHGERHAYAQGRYEALVGAPCPVAAGVAHGAAHHRFLSAQLGISIAAARERDQQARTQVAAELGHGRIDVTNSYLG